MMVEIMGHSVKGAVGDQREGEGKGKTMEGCRGSKYVPYTRIYVKTAQ
jgi:hypothetical protein